MAPKSTKQNEKEKEPRELTAAERKAVEKYQIRSKAKPTVRFKVSNNAAGAQIQVDHPRGPIGELLLMDAFGSADRQFVDGLVGQLAKADSDGKEIGENRLNFLVSAVNGIGPRDTVEAMLAVQMAVVHVTSMTMARRLSNAETIQQQDSAERAFNKLTRTYATQMEALKRYRSRGEPKVTLQQVSVSEGGQAIVGDVTHAPTEKVPEKAPASPSAYFSGTNVVPMPMGDDGKERGRVAGARKSSK
jgi:hypothetical protein